MGQISGQARKTTEKWPHRQLKLQRCQEKIRGGQTFGSSLEMTNRRPYQHVNKWFTLILSTPSWWVRADEPSRMAASSVGTGRNGMIWLIDGAVGQKRWPYAGRYRGGNFPCLSVTAFVRRLIEVMRCWGPVGSHWSSGLESCESKRVSHNFSEERTFMCWFSISVVIPVGSRKCSISLNC